MEPPSQASLRQNQLGCAERRDAQFSTLLLKSCLNGERLFVHRFTRQKDAALGTLKKTSWLQASLVAQLVKNLSAMWETWVQSLGWEDPLEKGTASHSRILVWRIPWAV